MKELRVRNLLVMIFAGIALAAPETAAARLSTDEQGCISAFTSSVMGVGSVRAKVVAKCLKRFAAGSLVSQSPEACVRSSLSDQDSKLRTAVFRTEAAASFSCATVTPPFGVTSSQRAIVVAAGKDVSLVRRLLGPNLDDALIPNVAGSRCQQRVAAALQKCADTRLKEYQKCLRAGMSDGTIVDAASVREKCLGGAGQTQPDPLGRIAKACEARIAKAVSVSCAGVPLARAFSACESSDVGGVTSCAERESACELCQTLNEVNGLSQDCDAFDDGNPDNGTCGDECGDGVVQSGEGCDDGNTVAGDGCAADCRLEAGWGCTGEPSQCARNCGNGEVDAADSEQCDDGNATDGDGCSSTCQLENCGDGGNDLGESCDDGNHTNNDGCSSACQVEPGYLCNGTPSVCEFVCGNNQLDAGEGCDDGNTAEGDGCDSVCRVERGFSCLGVPSVCSGICGDGLVRTGERCDDGNLSAGDGCANSCQPETGYHCSGEPSRCEPTCGDGYQLGNETCDDGNTHAGDGCSASCREETGWACSGQPSVCTARCGNSRLDAGEQCDDGNAVSGDGCHLCVIEPGFACGGQPSTCNPTCGNGVLNLGEQCDDNNTNNNDGCTSGCLVEPGYECAIGVGGRSYCDLSCGDGNLDAGEECDDDNANDADGCSGCAVTPTYYCSGQPSVCTVTCGNGLLQAGIGEECDDGDTSDGDGCNSSCKTEPGFYCGSGVCQRFDVFIDSPAHGSFTTATTVEVRGHYTVLPAERVSLLVNGEPPLGWNPETGEFMQPVTLDPSKIVNPVKVTLADKVTGDDVHDRIVIIYGNSVEDGDFSPESVALRINESGLASIQSLITKATTGLDLGSMMPSGNLIDQCFIDVGFLGCWGRARVSMGSPPPSIGNIGLGLDSQPEKIRADINVNAIRVDININGSGLVPSCGLRLSANRLTIADSYAMSPSNADPHYVDVNSVGPLNVGFINFNQRFTWGICTWPIIGDIINAILPNIGDMATSAMRDALKDPDGGGPAKSLIAQGMQSALAGMNISGSVGAGVSLNFDAPMFKIEEDHVGVTVGANSRFTVSRGTGPGQCNPPPDAPDFGASYSRYEPFPPFGATSPVRRVPYGLGIAISTAGFNQLLRGQTECGLMRTSITEFDLDGSGPGAPMPITSDLLSMFIPGFAFLPPGTPLRIDVAPTLAPMVTGRTGPNGEVADLLIEQLAIDIVDPSTDISWLGGAFDARLGLDLGFAADGSGLGISINPPNIDDVKITVVENPLGADEATVETLLPSVMVPMIPSLAGALSGFPLPQFFGMKIEGVEVSRNGEFLSLFANLVPSS